MRSIAMLDSHPSIEDLEQEICELAAHLAAGTCRWLLLIGEFDERLGWAEWGVKSCAHWLSWRCGVGLGAGREHVRVARRLKELPIVRRAFAAGELTYCKVRAITRIAATETEESIVEIARHATGAQLEKLARGYRGALAETLGANERAYERRSVNWDWEDDGSLSFRGRLPADEGALLLSALEAEKRLAEELEADAPDVRDADALVSLARSALAAGSVARAGGDPCEVVVHVDADTLAGDEVRDRSQLADGPALAPETVRRLGCDAAVFAVIERDGKPVAAGRRKRTIAPALRRALRARDDGCQFPGCTHSRFLHAHHIRHWARGGPTTMENLVQLCSHHHRLVHEGGFGVERTARQGVRFRRPDGRVIASAAPARRADGPGLSAQHRMHGIAIDGDTCRPRSAGDRLDYGLAVECLLARALAAT